MAREIADVEMIVTEILRAGMPDVEVGTQTPPSLAISMPVIRVHTLGGRRLDAAPRLGRSWHTVDIQSWDGTRQGASDLADRAGAVLYDAAANQTLVPGRGYVSSVSDDELPFELALTGAPEKSYRFQATYIVRVAVVNDP